MNGRERLTRVLHGKPTDRVAWTTIADDSARVRMSDEYRNCNVLDFYRKIGCDIMQFGAHGMPVESSPQYPYEFFTEVAEYVEKPQDDTVISIRDFNGRTLKAVSRNGHPVKYPVETVEELKIFLDMVDAGFIQERSDDCFDSFLKCDEAIGNDGIFAPTMNPSPVQQLIEFECGIEAFYYLLADQTELMEKVINSLFERKYAECKILAEKTPFELIIPIENTSTALISPALYRKYSLPQIKALVDVIKQNNKKAVVHMCGHLFNLLPEIKETGLDGIHAPTPPNTGNCPFEAALDVIGEDLIIFGILQPELFHDPLANADDIKKGVKTLLTPRIKESNFILWPGIDGIATELWRLEAIRDAIEEYGVRN